MRIWVVVCLAVSCLVFGIVVGYVSHPDKGASARQQAQEEALSKQMDQFCSGKTVHLVSTNTYLTAAAQPFIIHGARYGGRNSDFVFEAEQKFLTTRLVIRDGKGNVLHSANVSETYVAKLEGLNLLETLAQGEDVAGNQRYIEIQKRAPKVLGELNHPKTKPR